MICPSSPGFASASGALFSPAASSFTTRMRVLKPGASGTAGLGRRQLVDGEGVNLRRAIVIDEQLRPERVGKALEQRVVHRRAGKAYALYRGHSDLQSPRARAGHDKASARDRGS